MHKPIDFELAAHRNRPARRKMTRETMLRKARARKQLERRRDRQRLRKHIEEVWN